jgi:MoaA/NifB/PqqE/SkfB family radical SAM enzyme
MFKFNELNRLHLEVSSNCQAKCPLCPRTVKGSTNPNLTISSWSLSDYQKILPAKVIKQLEYIFFCGNYGDPVMCTDLIDMIAYTIDINPKFSFGIHTNGSLRTQSWWEELAITLPEAHKVTFALDGLSDTHDLYRIGTDFNKIIGNARAFIDAGGQAEWQFIRFRHNEHQVAEAEQMAKDLGFMNFWMRDSREWNSYELPVYDGDSITHYLEPATDVNPRIITSDIIQNLDNIMSNINIDCAVKHRKEAFITYDGTVLPCCYLGQIPHLSEPDNVIDQSKTIAKKIDHEYHDLIYSLGGTKNLNALKNSLGDIINSEQYQTVWDTYWNNKKLITCAKTCGKQSDDDK